MRVITSQPTIIGVHPLEPDLHAHLWREAFEPLEAVDGTPTTNDWFRATDRVLIFDAHTGNFIQTADGWIIPIDIYAEQV